MFNKNKPPEKVNAHVFDDAVLSFQAPEYIQHQKSALWFVVAALIGAALVFYGLATDGWTFSVAILVFAATYYLFHKEKPPVVTVKISKMGIKVGRHIFPYTSIKNFWIVYDPPLVKKLYLRMRARVQPDVYVSLEDVDPAELRHALSGHIKEAHGRTEPFADVLARLFKL